MNEMSQKQAGKRSQINTDDVGLMDEKNILLQPGIDADEIAVVTEDSMRSKAIQEYAQELAFMDDDVTFSIGHSELENAPDPVECAVNGEKKQFYRAMEYTVKRKFLNALINVCWNTHTKITKNAENLDATTVSRKPYLAYNISIHRDPSPHGKKWLEYKMNGDMHVKKH